MNEPQSRFWFAAVLLFFRLRAAAVVVPVLTVLLLALAGCAPKNQPLLIDRSQIDLAAFMVQDLDSPSGTKYFNLLYPGDSPGRPGTNVVCHLLKWSAADQEKLITKLMALSGRNVRFTDGATLIATGRISGVVGGGSDPSGLTVTFESPDTVKALARAFGTTR